MESLYRKYRPQTFADVVGQQHVVGTLEHAVLEGRTSHAYLFCGPRGTGKTTMARLLAKALMCEQGPAQLPCGACTQCQLIAAGEHPDVYELDAASRTGVDSVREEIINSVSYAPTQGRCKVYIIDEVHMLTTAAFNALLKTLEEPPSHVVFVLCTTDPQKIPATILSRVQRFDFRPIGNEDIRAHLAYVCEQEGFTYEDAALELITSNARGGMRDALSTLEQLSVFGSGVISLDATRDMLGAVSGMALDNVVVALAQRDVSALFAQVGELVNAGRDLLQFTRELAAHLRDVYVVAVVGANPSVLPMASDVNKLQAEAAAFGSADRLARMLALLGDVSREMSTAPNQRLVLEIAFTRMARPQEDLNLESLAERVAELERKLEGVPVLTSLPVAAQPASVAEDKPEEKPVTPANTTEEKPVTQPAPAPAVARSYQPAPTAETVPVPAPQPAQRPAQPAQRPAPAPRPVQSAPQPAQSARRPAQAPQPAPAETPKSSQGGLDAGALQRAWRQVVSELVARIPARGTLLTNAVATTDDGNQLVVSLPKGSTFALKMLERPDVRSVVEGVVTEVFGQRTLVFKEGTATDLQLPTRRQKPAPAQWTQPAPAPAAQQSAPQPQQAPVQQAAPQPAPAPAPAQQPAPQSQPAPASQPVQQPAPQPQPAPQQQPQPNYPMPWDEPAAPAASEDPYYEVVPYEELGGYEDDDSYAYEPASAQPAPSSTPAPAPAPTSAPAPTQQSVPQSEPDPAPQPAPEPEPQADPDILTELPPELASVLENAFEVFGTDVRVSRNS